jgi:ABC-2 type transport system ATP-binding protein
LFLDEPSAGLDPQSRIAMWEAVQQLRAEGITIVLTTHYMEEADELCDRLAIIDHGKILIEGSPAELRAGIGGDKIYELRMSDAANTAQLESRLRETNGVTSVEPISGGLRVLAKAQDGLLAHVVTIANEFGLRDITTTEPNLETVFIRLTGRDLRE